MSDKRSAEVTCKCRYPKLGATSVSLPKLRFLAQTPRHLDTSKRRHASPWSAHIRPNCLPSHGLAMLAIAATPRSCAASRRPTVTRASDAPNSALDASSVPGPGAAGPSDSQAMTTTSVGRLKHIPLCTWHTALRRQTLWLLPPHPTLGHHHLSLPSWSRSTSHPQTCLVSRISPVLR